MTQHYHAEMLGELVARNYRYAAILERFGIDFSLGGRRSFSDACRDAGVDPDEVGRALDAVPSDERLEEDVREWPVSRLVDHIVTTHHSFVRAELPAMVRESSKIASLHGQRHPELYRVAEVVDELREELLQHLEKEEAILFPYLRELEHDEGVWTHPFVTVANPLRVMEHEHVEAGDHIKTLRTLTADYSVPDDGCAIYRVAMQRLAAFEHDLQRHIHLENNVLFPKARAIERERQLWRE